MTLTPHARSGTATPVSDADVIRRVLAGDVDAYATLVARHRDRLARFAYHMLGNREDAEDAVQDAFVRAYRALPRCANPARFDAWLFRILVNRCRTRGARRTRLERTFVQDEVALERAAEAHPADRLAIGLEIEHALAQLDGGQREAFLMKHVEELEYEERSAMTGVGVSALKMRVKRACDRLRTILTTGQHA